MSTNDSEFSDRAAPSRRAEWRWRAACLALVFPLTAILHHTLFFPQACMLNGIGPDYTPEVIASWLARDPSLPLATAFAWIFYGLSHRFCSLRIFLVPFLIGFAPLSVWIWDIPFTERAICASMHDQQIVFPTGSYLRSRHLYILGAIIFVALVTWSWRRSRHVISRG